MLYMVNKTLRKCIYSYGYVLRVKRHHNAMVARKKFSQYSLGYILVQQDIDSCSIRKKIDERERYRERERERVRKRVRGEREREIRKRGIASNNM